MTDSKTHIAALIDAAIAGKGDSIDFAKLAVQQKTVELLNPPQVAESQTHTTGPRLEPGVRLATTTTTHSPPTTVTPPTTTVPDTDVPGPSEPNPPTPSPITEGLPAEAGGIVSEWTQRFAEGDEDRQQVYKDLVALVDFGDVPEWLVEQYKASPFVEFDKTEPTSVELAFGPDTGFIKFLNGAVPNSGNELLKIWDAEHYGISGE